MSFEVLFCLNCLQGRMDFGGSEGDEIGMRMPMNFEPVQESSRLRILSTNSNGGGASASGSEEIRGTGPEPAGGKKAFLYRECLKNHAATLGGHAVDGCGEFMASGEEGTLEALTCAVCNCHRNFHRREVEGEPSCPFCNRKRAAFMPVTSAHAHTALPLPQFPAEEHTSAAGTSAAAAALAAKKRFRTKFTLQQKEKMLDFAGKLGWRIQKQDEPAVQQFCAEAGVKRHVLKVWMHNNKNTLGKIA